MAPARSLPGDGGGTAEPPEPSGPERASLPGAPPPTPLAAAAPAAASSSSRALRRLHPNARAALGAAGSAPATCPQPSSGAGPGSPQAGWPAAGGPRCACAEGAVHSGTCSSAPGAHLSSARSYHVRRGAEVGGGGVAGGFALSILGRERFSCFRNKVEPRIQRHIKSTCLPLSLF